MYPTMFSLVVKLVRCITIVLMPNLWLIFTTGLVAGGLTCAAVQGGLLAATVAEQGNRDQQRVDLVPTLSFLIAKLIAYTVLGFVLGLVGSTFQFSLKLQAILLAVAAIFMIGTALDLIHLHPVFRYFTLQPPQLLTRFIRRQTKSQHVFAPAIVGASTIFLPCGTTQAMMALAMATQNWIRGGAILFTFILGTFPIFFLLGYSVEKLKDTLQTQFYRAAAAVIVFLALWNINTAAVLAGSPITAQTILTPIYCTITFCPTPLVLGNEVPSQNIVITIGSRSYSVDHTVIPAGKPVHMTLVNKGGVGCIQSFTIPRLGIQQVVPLGQTKTFTFTAPTDTRLLTYVCSMGMYGGSFVIAGGGT